ncbi:hypothetical protein ACG9XW_08340 [Acinetobacter guillouiae]
MRTEDTVCRTCGAEYKASYAFLIIVFLLIVFAASLGAWWYFSQKQIEKDNLRKSNIAAYIEVLRNLDLPARDLERIANLRYSDNIKHNKFAFAELKELAASFNDQRELSNKVMRVELVQPLSELQKIKRNTQAKKYTGCLEASKLIYVSSMNSTNEALLTFLADGGNKGDQITHLFTKSIVQENEAKKVLDECEINATK